MRKTLLLLFIAVFALLSMKKDSLATDIADQLYINGHIWTADPSLPFVEALAVKGDKILAVGSNTDLNQFKTLQPK